MGPSHVLEDSATVPGIVLAGVTVKLNLCRSALPGQMVVELPRAWQVDGNLLATITTESRLALYLFCAVRAQLAAPREVEVDA